MKSTEEVRGAILDIVQYSIDDAKIGIDDVDKELSLLGMDSISFVRIIVSIEEVFEIEVPDEFLLIAELPTINKMVDVVVSAL